jgi:hypothetical protein
LFSIAAIKEFLKTRKKLGGISDFASPNDKCFPSYSLQRFDIALVTEDIRSEFIFPEFPSGARRRG